MLRSLLFIPSHKIRFVDGVLKKNPDAICFDLEDALPDNKKKFGLEKLKIFLNDTKIDYLKFFIRIEDIEKNNYDNVLSILNSKVHSLVLPKISNVKSLKSFEKRLKMFEKKNKIKKKITITLLIESIEGIFNLPQLIDSSNRVKYIIYGEEDFLNDFGYLDFDSTPNLNFFKSYISFIGKKNKLELIYTPYLYIKNFLGLKKHIKESQRFGFTGMLTVHPSQIPIVNKSYLPSKKNFNTAKLILNLNKNNKYKDQNISISRGKLLGPPMKRRAKKIINIFNLINER